MLEGGAPANTPEALMHLGHDLHCCLLLCDRPELLAQVATHQALRGRGLRALRLRTNRLEASGCKEDRPHDAVVRQTLEALAVRRRAERAIHGDKHGLKARKRLVQAQHKLGWLPPQELPECLEVQLQAGDDLRQVETLEELLRMVKAEDLGAGNQQHVQEQAVEARGLLRELVVQPLNGVLGGVVISSTGVACQVVATVPVHLVERAQALVADGRSVADAPDLCSATGVRAARRHDWAATFSHAVKVALWAPIPRDALGAHSLVDQLPLIPGHARQIHGLQCLRPAQGLAQEAALGAGGCQADRVEGQREEALGHRSVAEDLPAVVPQGIACTTLLAVRAVAGASHPTELQLRPG
mmetsp:Transcript_50514/g.146594  ORF Transcript_50514/g.146594 Transcript_50514/m.146594 type:complete len:356 (+) Transcript_50514:1797-2864(+)